MTDGNQDPAVGAADREAFKREQATAQGQKMAKGCGLVVLGLLLLCFVVGLLSTCSSTPPTESAAKPGSIATATPQVKKVEKSGRTLRVELMLADAWDEPAYIDALAREVEAVGKVLKAKAVEDGPEIEEVFFHVETAGTDRLGNTITLTLANLTFPAADLRAANYEGLSNGRLLNLADQFWPAGAAGRQSFEMWCAKNSADASVFCAKANL